jgi:hypothetical protein
MIWTQKWRTSFAQSSAAIIGAVLTTVVLMGPSAHAQTREFDTDRLGSDYAAICVRVFTDCEWHCQRDARCHAWTVVTFGVAVGAHGQQCQGAMTCYLKDAVPPPTNDRCCISGVVRGQAQPAAGCRWGQSLKRPGSAGCFCHVGPQVGGYLQETDNFALCGPR